MALKVTATPEYFVNGRPMPSFGEQQLQDLISEALQSAYRSRPDLHKKDARVTRE
jgi:hypothetical protein